MTAVVVAAIAAGAVAGVKDVAAQAVKDAYAGLKSLLARKYKDVDVSGVERKPDSDIQKASLAEDLDDAGAAGDTELAAAAAALLAAVREHAPAAVAGVDVDNLVAAVLDISDVESVGDGVRVKNSRITGEARISGVRAGFGEPRDPGPARA